VSTATLGAATPISRGHRGVVCSGDPAGMLNACPSPATEFLLSQGLVGTPDEPELGWVCLSFCQRHKGAVLGFVGPRLGPLGDEAIVAEIGALPRALREVVGIDAAIEGLDEGVVTNVFGVRAAVG
jgi:hypothetical protein